MNVQFSQSGPSLDTGSGAFPAGCAGTIDPGTGTFSLVCSPHPGGVLPGGFLHGPSPAPTIDGTDADGLTMDGTFIDWFIKTSPPTDLEHFPWFPDGGSFHGVSRFCGNGLLDAGEQCDDGRSCTTGETCTGGTWGGGTDTCGPCLACGLNGSCVPHIEVTCRRTTKFLGSSLVLHARTDAARDSFIWKWTAGSQLSPGDLGNPLGADAYTLCIFRATRPTCCSSGRPRWPAARAVRNPAGERG